VWDYYNQRKLANQRISDQTVIEIARENGGKVDIALLCENTGVSVKMAKTKLEYLAEHKLLAKDWQDMLFGSAGVYRLPNSQNENIVSKFLNTKGSLVKRIEALFDNSSHDTKSLPAGSPNKDAQIISLAIENHGTVTASSVCVKLNITIDEAQKRLEDLRQKQIFMTEVGQNGGIVYRLLDA
jgi:predicted ArsR family transcriptional regulator